MQRTVSMPQKQEEEEDERRGTFRPPFDPNANKYSKNRTDAENFTFSKRDSMVARMRQLKSAENPFQGVSRENLINKLEQQQDTIVEVKSMAISVNDSQNQENYMPTEPDIYSVKSPRLIKHRSKGAQSTLRYSDQSLDLTYNSQQQRYIKKKKNMHVSGRS